jgi:hypothetical protein
MVLLITSACRGVPLQSASSRGLGLTFVHARPWLIL